MSDYVSPTDAAKILAVKPQTVREWIKQGLLPAHKIGRIWRINRAHIGILLGEDSKGKAQFAASRRVQTAMDTLSRFGV